MGDAGVRHHASERPVTPLGLRDHAVDLLGARDVEVVVLGLAAVLRDLRSDRLSFVVEHVGHDDPVARFPEGAGRGRPDADAGAGDKDRLPLRVLHTHLAPLDGVSSGPHSITSPELGPSVCPT